MAHELTVLLGASGSLGRRVALRLGEAGYRLLLVGRTRAPLQELALQLPDSAAVSALDVTAGNVMELVGQIERCADPLRRLVIIDAVLDKTSISAMRRSLLGAARIVAELVAWSHRRRHEVLVVSANSIAAHARWPSSTTYGRLKRRQVLVYSALSAPAAIVYLPFLYGGAPSGTNALDQLLWPYFDFQVRACSFDLAADLLCAVATSDHLPGSARALQVELATRNHLLLELRGLTSGRPPRIVAALAALPIAVLGKSLCRSSPAWQRRSAYACLFMMPGRLRDARDHHRLLHHGSRSIVDLRAVQVAGVHVREGNEDERRSAAVRLPWQ